MSINKLTIVPVKLDPLPIETSSLHPSQYTDAPGCVIKTEVAEKSMKHDFTMVQNSYIVCGKTDMRKGIDGLQRSFKILSN